GLDEINENINLVNLEYQDIFAIEEFFDFDVSERDQEAFSLDNNYSILQSIDSEEGWSIKDIISS
ncbi:6883_t:CDS:1, partial [Gigaspora margarita]